MSRPNLLLRLLFAALALAAFSASPAFAAKEGISNARPVNSSATTKQSGSGGGGGKEALSLTTVTPGSGQTVSGSIVWEVAVAAGSPSRVDFSVDGSVLESRTEAPYRFGGAAGTLDTTTLANGSHTLSATAYGSRGVKATTSVTVVVSNAAPEPAPVKEPEPAPESEPLPEVQPGGPIYWGATIGSQLTGGQAPWDMTAVAKFEEMTQKSLSLIQFFQPFSNCSSSGSCSFYSFPTTPLENVRQHGAIPVLSWSSQSIPSSLNEPDYQLSDLIEGRYDNYIRSFATAAKNWGHPFFLRFDWEMNGNWFPWSEGVNGNKSGEFVTAWRHVHDIFTSVGATNVTWVWCPNVDWNGKLESLASTYPGDAYVDWAGLDGYNWGTNPARPSGWKSFEQVYRSTYRYMIEKVAPSKPIMIGEVASSEYGGSKAEWIREMLTKIPSEYTSIRALLWFDKLDENMDWPIESSSTSISAFAEGIRSSSYVANTFSSLGFSAIQPAS